MIGSMIVDLLKIFHRKKMLVNVPSHFTDMVSLPHNKLCQVMCSHFSIVMTSKMNDK